MAFATIIAIVTGWNTRSFLLGWLAVGALALTYRQTAVTLFSGLKKIQQQRAVHKSLKNKTAFRRAMLPVAMRMLGLLAIGWGSVFWILF
ncbi:MAG: hypothetical protein DME04_24000 [Candidatus Rokuibacteriota bacterium]|nr:MAG: hypothetical protein DME04_24000 [Candidatus Rokubacteria bacterium]